MMNWASEIFKLVMGIFGTASKWGSNKARVPKEEIARSREAVDEALDNKHNRATTRPAGDAEYNPDR